MLGPVRTALVLTAALAAVPTDATSQQLWFARNDDGSYSNNAVGWPAAVLAFRFTAPSAATITAAQIFTGNQPPALHTLEIRTHDPLTGLPGTLVGAPGTWSTLHARCFQGPALGAPAVLAGGQDYWLVWRVTGMFHQHSVSDTNPGNVPVEVRVSDGVSYFAQVFLPAKFRLFQDYQAGTTTAFGTAKAGTNGLPTIGFSGWPAIGSVIDLWLDDTVYNQAALLVLGLPVPAGIPLPFGISWTTADTSFFAPTLLHTSPFVGAVSMSLTVPPDPGFAGVGVAFQWGILDPGAADGIAHTAAVVAVLQ